MGLTLEEANRVLRGALAKAQELNIKISAAVCDAGGRLVAFQRMDNAIWASAYASQGKAVASAAFGRPSGEMAERADQPTPRGIAAAEGGHMIMGQGAVPIIRNGVVEGPAALAAAPVSRTKTAPAPASRNCSTPVAARSGERGPVGRVGSTGEATVSGSPEVGSTPPSCSRGLTVEPAFMSAQMALEIWKWRLSWLLR